MTRTVRPMLACRHGTRDDDDNDGDDDDDSGDGGGGKIVN